MSKQHQSYWWVGGNTNKTIRKCKRALCKHVAYILKNKQLDSSNSLARLSSEFTSYPVFRFSCFLFSKPWNPFWNLSIPEPVLCPWNPFLDTSNPRFGYHFPGKTLIDTGQPESKKREVSVFGVPTAPPFLYCEWNHFSCFGIRHVLPDVLLGWEQKSLRSANLRL